MTDRDRLIELIMKSKAPLISRPLAEKEADHLIANGVICPPCQVGDMVYLCGIYTGQIIPTKVVGINIAENDVFLLGNNFTCVSVADQLGKTVFLTKEEAEEKLKEWGNEIAT